MTRRASRFVIHVLGTLIGVASILLVGLAWRLAQGPIVFGSVTPYIEAAINDQELGFRVQIDDAQLAWDDWQEAFEVRTLGVHVYDDEGNQILSAHEVVLEMSMPPLVRGELRPRSVTLVRPWVTAVRGADGTMIFALMDTFGSEEEPASRPNPIVDEASTFRGRDLVDGFLAAGSEAPFDRLEDVLILGADLWVDDRLLDVMWNAPAATIAVRRLDHGLSIETQLVLQTEGHTLDADISAVYLAESREVSISCLLSDFALNGVSDLVPQLPDLGGVDVVADVHLELLFDRDLELLYGSFLIDAQAGRIDLPAVFEEAFDIGPSLAQGSLRPGFSGLEVTDLELDLGIEEVHARIVLDGFTLDANLDALFDIAGLPIGDLSRYWPVPVVKTARGWILEHVSSGVVDRASIAFQASIEQLAAGQLPLESLIIDLDVSDVTIDYLSAMPKVRGFSGHVAVIDDTLRIDSSGGTVDGITSTRSVITMDALNGDAGMLIGAEMHGTVRDALLVASHEPFALASRVGIDPDLIAGTFDGRLEIVLPKLAGLTPADVLYRVAADGHDVALTTELRGYALDGGSVTLLLDSEVALLEGNVRLNGVPFAGTYRHNFRPDAETLRVVNMRGRVDDADRAALGMVDPIDIDGPVDVVLDMSQSADETMTWNVVVDLAPSAIDFPLIGIDKAVGDAGRAALRLVDDGGAFLYLEAIELDIASTVVEGSGVLRSGDASLSRLDLTQFVFGRSDFSGAVSVREDDVFDVTLSGGTVDMEPLMEDVAASSGPTLPSFQIRGVLDRIWITDNDTVQNVHIDGTYVEDRWEALAITGAIENETPMSVTIWRFSPDERRFEYNAGNAGDAIRAFGLFDNATGGALQIRARIDDSDPETPADGAIRMEGFVLKEAPILTEITSSASLTAMVSTLTEGGLEFDGALMPFHKEGDVVTLYDARVFGPSIGITIGGTVDLGTDQLDLAGTLVPAYMFNSALGEIPLLGDILTGTEEGGGIFAFAFDVTGHRDEPEVIVDPLSVLAPGILRNMFTAPTDDEVERIIEQGNKPEGGR
ncbi:MAG: hypothetical protein HOL02_10930 [Rhodospirillaceae bacterium]|nr:hypothetical protein [Rhodospirillaceae bacterium]